MGEKCRMAKGNRLVRQRKGQSALRKALSHMRVSREACPEQRRRDAKNAKFGIVFLTHFASCASQSALVVFITANLDKDANRCSPTSMEKLKTEGA
jgi:hypothetical protein